MSGIDRRGAIRRTALVVATLALPASLFAGATRPALFIFDGRIARARRAAATWQAAGVPVLDRMQEDLGRAWRRRIPAAAIGRAGAIAGLTLWVDSYICESFGRENGMAMQRDPLLADDPLHGWVLR